MASVVVDLSAVVFFQSRDASYSTGLAGSCRVTGETGVDKTATGWSLEVDTKTLKEC